MTPWFHSRPARRRRAAAGFTLAEVMVTLAIFAIVIIAILAIFDINSRIARVEGHVTDMQQSLRIAQSDLIRILRMGARGGLPAAQHPNVLVGYAGKLLPSGVAIEVANNVPANTTIAGDATNAPVLEGTDILTVRGVFTTVYQVNPAGAGFTLTDDNADGIPDKGELFLSNLTPTGVPQDLEVLAKAIEDRNPEAFIMANPHTDFYAVVEIDPSTSSVARSGTEVTQVKVGFITSGTTHSNFYKELARDGHFPESMETVAYVGILDEYRYYIRGTRPLNAANVAALEPALARARLYPGTNIPYAYAPDDPTEDPALNLREEVASDIFDLQVALAVDANGDSVILEGTDAASRRTDEWLFNENGDDATATATWNGTAALPSDLYYLRVSTLARSARRDAQPQWQARALGRFEDKDYTQSPFNLFNTANERKFRRQSMQTLVDLRSLS